MTNSASIPALETARLGLRAFTAEDAGRVQQLAGDDEVSRLTSNIPHPYRDGMAEAWIEQHGGWASKGRAYVWAICHQGELVGAISLTDIAPGHQAELGFWLGRCAWGKGFMTEAARAVVEHAFESLGLTRLHSSHFAANQASGHVLEKLGFRKEGTQRRHLYKNGEFHDRVLYGLLAEEWDGGSND